MKRIFILLAAIVLGTTGLSAQYKDFTYDDNGSRYKLYQIDQYDDGSTVFFFTITSNGDRETFMVDDNTSIVVDGSFKKIRIATTGNIPFSSENKAALLEHEGDILTFVLEFDNVPLDKTFSIVENPNKQSPLMFNFNNIKVNTEAKSEKIDIVEFLNYSDYVTTGTFEKGGNRYRFYDVNGVTVASCLTEDWIDLTRVARVDVIVENFSGHVVNFSTSNIRAVATKNRKKGSFESCPIYSVSDYDALVRSQNASSEYLYKSEVSRTADDVRDFRRKNVSTDDIAGTLALSALEALIRTSDQEKIDGYKQDLEKQRQRTWDNYLQSVTLNTDESYGGFFAFHRKASYEEYHLIFNLNGHNYEFAFVSD